MKLVTRPYYLPCLIFVMGVSFVLSCERVDSSSKEVNTKERVMYLQDETEHSTGLSRSLLRLNKEGTRHLEAGEFQEAVERFEKALEIDSEVAGVHGNLAVAYSGIGNTEKEIFHYTEALRLNPNEFRYHFPLALALDSKNSEKAKIHFRKVIEHKPDSEHAQLAKAVLHRLEGNLEDAELVFGDLVKKSSRLSFAYNELAVIYEGQGERKKALRVLWQCTDVLPQSASCWKGIGILLERDGDVNAANEAYIRAVSINPMFLEALKGAADTSSDRGDVDAAKEYYERILELSPENERVKRRLEELS